MTMTTIDTTGYHLPKSWNELSEKELDRAGKLFLSGLKDSYLSFAFFFELLKIRGCKYLKRNFKRLGLLASSGNDFFLKLYDDYLEKVLAAAQEVSWISELPTLTKNPYPTLMKGMLHGVADRMTDISYLEYVTAEGAMRRFFDKKNIEDLNWLVAVLYAPVAPSGERLPVNPQKKKLWKNHLKKIRKIPFKRKAIVLIFFLSCYLELRKMFPKTFAPAENSNPEHRSFGHLDLILELAGEKFGNVDQTADTNLYTLLAHLERETEKYEDFKNR